MEFPWIYSISAVVVAYLFGSIPTSVWWGRVQYGVDVRDHGSRNAGATNTFRVLGWRAGVPVLIIDILKGFVPVRMLPNFSGMEPDSEPWMWLRVALVIAAVLGHLYPIFANFKGGKGMATSLGGILAVHPGAAGICVAVFLIVLLLSKYVSLSSLCAAITFPIAVALVYHETSSVKIGFAITLCLLVFFTHRENIARLMRGEENRMSLAGKNSMDR